MKEIKTLVILEGENQYKGSLFETLLAIHTFNPEKIILMPTEFYYNRTAGKIHQFFPKHNLESLWSFQEKQSIEKTLKDIDCKNAGFLLTKGLTPILYHALIDHLKNGKIITLDNKRLFFHVSELGEADIKKIYFFEPPYDYVKDPLPLDMLAKIIYFCLKQHQGSNQFPFSLGEMKLIEEKGFATAYHLELNSISEKITIEKKQRKFITEEKPAFFLSVSLSFFDAHYGFQPINGDPIPSLNLWDLLIN